MGKASNRFLVTCFLSALTVFIDATSASTDLPASLISAAVHQPSHLQEYYQLRNGCEWKLVDYLTITGVNDSKLLDNEFMGCEVEATFPEGKGYYRIFRIGPFVTSGGFDEIECKVSMAAASSLQENEGGWMTRSVSGPVDPYSGLFLGFPPLHLHHALVKSIPGYNPPRSDTPRGTIFTPKGGLWGTVSASSQCQESMGGTGCFSRILPIGYGIQRSQVMKVVSPEYFRSDTGFNHETMKVNLRLQDVREANSYALLSSMEFSIFYLTEPNQEMKSLWSIEMDIGRGAATYITSSDAPVYQFGTYYMPARMQLMSSIFHSHSMPGDEAWVVRGTQADLGIPEELWREPVYQYQENASHKQMAHAIPINEKDDTLFTLKTRMEDALEYAADKRRKELVNMHRPPKSSSPSTPANTTAVKSNPAAAMRKLKPLNLHDPPKSYAVPEILCKYYGTVENVDDDMVRKDKQAFFEAYAKYGLLANNSTTATASSARKFRGTTPNSPIVGFGPEYWPVSAADQLKAIFGSTMRGSYYRNTDSSQDQQQSVQ